MKKKRTTKQKIAESTRRKLIATHLKNLPALLGLSRKEFAARVGIKPEFYKKLVQGKKPLVVERALFISDAMGVRLESLLSGWPLLLAETKQAYTLERLKQWTQFRRDAGEGLRDQAVNMVRVIYAAAQVQAKKANCAFGFAIAGAIHRALHQIAGDFNLISVAKEHFGVKGATRAAFDYLHGKEWPKQPTLLWTYFEAPESQQEKLQRAEYYEEGVKDGMSRCIGKMVKLLKRENPMLLKQLDGVVQNAMQRDTDQEQAKQRLKRRANR